MEHLESLALIYDGRVRLLDQQRLPHEERWLDASEPDAMIGHIQALRVRGAPLIGVAAALSLAWLAETGASEDTLRSAARALAAARPTAVNLMAAMHRMLGALERGAALGTEAVALFREDVALCAAMAMHGARLLHDGDHVLTHCNTGGLATAGVGTALGAIRVAWEQGRHLHVWVDETRPLLQGGRLTSWELLRLGIPFTLITDSMAPVLMAQGQVQCVLVGADRVAQNGDFANKVGTYGAAVAAAFHGVPFYAVAPWTTVDLGCPEGAAIPIEERDPDEVRGAPGTPRWAPQGAPAWNPAFDVTPARLLTGLVLDTGLVSREQLLAGRLASLQPAAKPG